MCNMLLYSLKSRPGLLLLFLLIRMSACGKRDEEWRTGAIERKWDEEMDGWKDRCEREVSWERKGWWGEIGKDMDS